MRSLSGLNVSFEREVLDRLGALLGALVGQREPRERESSHQHARERADAGDDGDLVNYAPLVAGRTGQAKHGDQGT